MLVQICAANAAVERQKPTVGRKLAVAITPLTAAAVKTVPSLLAAR